MYRLNEEKMFYDFADGQAVVINYQTGMYYGMGLLGSAILDRIIAGNNVEEIITAVKSLPQCPSDIAERVHNFVKELKETEVIVNGPTVTGGAEPLAKEVAEDGFDLRIASANVAYFSPFNETNQFVKSIPPVINEITGIIISLTSELVILPNAVAITTPTAISSTFPRIINVLNSSKNFFISLPLKNYFFLFYFFVI